MQLNPAGTPHSGGENHSSTLVALTDVLNSECRLLRELLVVMQRQREAISADDLEQVEESVYSIHRVLLTLNEARRRRRTVNRMLGESDDLSIHSLEGVLGGRMTEELKRARDELEILAKALSAQVDVNRRLLRTALASGEEYVRTLRGAVDPRVGYSAGPPTADAERAGGLILNRLA